MKKPFLYAMLAAFVGVVGCGAASQDLGNSDKKTGGGEGDPSGGDPAAPAPTTSSTTPPANTTPPPNNPPPATATFKWTVRSPMPTKRTRLGAAFAPDGKLYAIGGYTSSAPTGAVEVYDPAQDSWSTASPMPTPRYGFATMVDTSGKIWTVGGHYAKDFTVGPSATVEIYDPVTDTWSPGPSLPEGRYLGAGAVRADGTLLFAGGLNITSNTIRSSVYALPQGATSWSTVSPMTSPRTSFAMITTPAGSTYAVGGRDSSGDLVSAEERASAANGFSTLPTMPQAQSGHAVAIGSDGRIFVLGTGAVVAFDPKTRTWSTAAPTSPTSGFLYAAAATAPDGTIYVVGGEKGGPVNDVLALAKK